MESIDECGKPEILNNFLYTFPVNYSQYFFKDGISFEMFALLSLYFSIVTENETKTFSNIFIIVVVCFFLTLS